MGAPLPLEHRTVASFDGTPIGVQLAGAEGAPLLLLANGLGATIGAYQPLMERFARSFRFVSWDYRGLHSSGRPVGGYDTLDVAHHAKDALAVLDAVGGTKLHALGWSMGVQVLLELYRLAPERLLTLVLHNGVAGSPWRTVGGGRAPAVQHLIDPLLSFGQRIDHAVEAGVARVVDWRGFIPLAARLGLVHPALDRDVFLDVARGFKRLDMHLYVEILRRLGRHDAFDLLPRVAAPTLIVHGQRDLMTPLSVAERMARAMPNAQLVVVPEGTHYAAVEVPGLIHQHLQAFWRAAGVE